MQFLMHALMLKSVPNLSGWYSSEGVMIFGVPASELQ
jgi:hypothetical protein